MENPRKIADIIKIITEYHRPNMAVVIDINKEKKIEDKIIMICY